MKSHSQQLSYTLSAIESSPNRSYTNNRTDPSGQRTMKSVQPSLLKSPMTGLPIGWHGNECWPIIRPSCRSTRATVSQPLTRRDDYIHAHHIANNFILLLLLLRLQVLQLDLRVGSSKSTQVDLDLPSGVKSVGSGVTVDIFWRHRSHYKSFQVDLKSRLDQ